MTAPVLSVGICTVGRSPHLASAIRSVLAQEAVDFELLVVDNAPGTGAVGVVVATFDDPRLRLVSAPIRGLSSARNRVIAAADGEIIVFTDDDAEAASGWLAAIDRVFAVDPDVVCVTGRVRPADTDRDVHRWFEQGFGFDRGDRPLAWSGAGRATAAHLAQLRATMPDVEAGPVNGIHAIAGGVFGSGNNMAFRRDWLRATGGFDEALGAGSLTRGGEDLDAFRRVAFDGGLIAYEPRALVRHHHRPTIEALTAQAFAYGAGMAASVARYAASGPSASIAVLRALPPAARMLLARGSEKNRAKTDDYPRRLDWAERAGYAVGPLLAAISAVEARRRRTGRLA